MPSREYLAWRATFTATYDRANDGRVHEAGGFPKFVTRDLWVLTGGSYEDVADLYERDDVE